MAKRQSQKQEKSGIEGMKLVAIKLESIHIITFLCLAPVSFI